MLLALAPTEVPLNSVYQVYCSPMRALNHGHPGAWLLHEWNISDLGDPTVGVRTTRFETEIGGAPAGEVLAGEHDPVVVAVGKRSIAARFVENVGRVTGNSVGEARVQFLEFINVAAAQRDPEIVTLILILRIKAEIGVVVGLRESTL